MKVSQQQEFKMTTRIDVTQHQFGVRSRGEMSYD